MIYMNREEALACVKERLTEHRYIHTIGVTDTAVILAGRFGADPKKRKWRLFFMIMRNSGRKKK